MRIVSVLCTDDAVVGRIMKTALRAVVLAAMSVLSACATSGGATSFNEGDWVLARWQEDEAYYWPAIVASRRGDHVDLRYHDGDVGDQHIAKVRAFDWRPGARVECRWADGAIFYPGRIAQMSDDRRRIEVAYDDGDKESTDTSRCRAEG